MCLSIVYQGKKKKEALDKLPESGYYWKLVEKHNGKYLPPVQNAFRYKSGWNKTKTYYKNFGYKIGYHLFRTKYEAELWRDCWYDYETPKKRSRIVRCKVMKKDIVAIGRKNGGLCVVTARFWCPKPK